MKTFAALVIAVLGSSSNARMHNVNDQGVVDNAEDECRGVTMLNIRDTVKSNRAEYDRVYALCRCKEGYSRNTVFPSEQEDNIDLPAKDSHMMDGYVISTTQERVLECRQRCHGIGISGTFHNYSIDYDEKGVVKQWVAHIDAEMKSNIEPQHSDCREVTIPVRQYQYCDPNNTGGTPTVCNEDGSLNLEYIRGFGDWKQDCWSYHHIMRLYLDDFEEHEYYLKNDPSGMQSWLDSCRLKDSVVVEPPVVELASETPWEKK